jgi:hypothetical protein
VFFFLALTCLAAATLGSVALYQRGEERRLLRGERPRFLLQGGHDDALPSAPRQTPTRPPAAGIDEPSVESLAPGDIVGDGVVDWLVAGSVYYREEDDAWALHVLDGGVRQRFLEVRRRAGRLEVSLLDVAEGLARGQLLDGLSFHGQSFALEGRGDARTVTRGDVGGSTSQAGTLQWTRYGAVSGALLLVEDEAAARRGFVGARIPASSLSLLSGALNRAAQGDFDDKT